MEKEPINKDVIESFQAKGYWVDRGLVSSEVWLNGGIFFKYIMEYHPLNTLGSFVNSQIARPLVSRLNHKLQRKIGYFD